MTKNKPISWEDKERRIMDSNPEALNVSWHNVLRDNPDMFSRIIADVIKSCGGEAKPGKRPSLDRKDAAAIYNKIIGEDFSEHTFVETMSFISTSAKAVAELSGLPLSRVRRLLNGSLEPSFEEMETIAKVYHKEPSYFIEYRVGFVCTVIDAYLMDSPETATAWFLKLRG